MKHGAMRLLGIACILWAAVACSTTTDQPVTAADVIEPANANTHDPAGLPTRIESPVGAMHPSSSAGGAGNVTSSGTNTNLNPPAPAESSVSLQQSDIVVTQTPAETVTVVESPSTRTVTVVETRPVTTRTMTSKD